MMPHARWLSRRTLRFRDVFVACAGRCSRDGHAAMAQGAARGMTRKAMRYGTAAAQRQHCDRYVHFLRDLVSSLVEDQPSEDQVMACLLAHINGRVAAPADAAAALVIGGEVAALAMLQLAKQASGASCR